jgi:mono/diheme cytochrome c family protein
MVFSDWCRRAGLIGICLGLHATGPATEAGEAAPRITFEQHVRPILKAHCFSCHGDEEKPKGKLDLRLVRTINKGGTSGQAIVAGRHEESLLWERIDGDEMPPGEKKLTPGQKATVTAWIDQGAATVRPEPEALAAGVVVTEEDRTFWSFRPIRRPEVPPVRDASRVRTPIDAFLLGRLESEGLGFAPEADRRTLVRRITFDLTGLPPTPAEVAEFVADRAPDALERLVDRLLATPQYGEHWARHWLDVAGYADSDGYTPTDLERKYAWKYRDYVVRAFNTDRSWDELIREQLAGDEMVAPPYANLAPADVDKLIATGFLRMAPDGTGSDTGADPNVARNDVVAETIKIVSSSLLGLTVGCAQCHAHRYDPIAHEDYYRFRALFEPALDWKHWRGPRERLISLWSEADRQRAAAADLEVKQIQKERAAAVEELVQQVLERELAAAPEDLREALRTARATPVSKRTALQTQLLKERPRVNVSAGNVSLYDAKAHRALLATFASRVAETEKGRPAEDEVQALTEVAGQVPTTYVFARGDFAQPRQAVEAGELTILAQTGGTPEIPSDDPRLPTTGRRLAYARHLTSGSHPLVARVLVNRVWLNHFGRGLVGTPADFGALGERPTHPELLDWLADDFMAGGWTLKRLHRMILTSTAYRQSSRRTAALDGRDPDNRLLGRMPVQRLAAEAVRDAILAATGRLNRQMFGPPVPVTPDETGLVIVGRDNRDTAGRPVGKRASLGGLEFRRSLYVQVRRSLPLGLLETFDAPTMSPNCDRRTSSTVAPQALLLMNNDFVITQADAFAERVAAEAGPESAAQVRLAWQWALSATPNDAQVASAARFLAAQSDGFAASVAVQQGQGDKASPQKPDPGPDPARQALASFCQALLSSSAFLYVD